MTIKFLGTSSEEALPREGCGCLQCASLNKKDTRLRSSILIDEDILIDAGPDILKQLKVTQIKNLRAVLITHDHYDHIDGLKDVLKIRRDLKIIKLRSGQHFKLTGIDFYAFKVRHSKSITTVGIEIGSMIYIPDFSDLDYAMKYLAEVKVAVLDGSFLSSNLDGHLAINETISRTKPLKNLKKIYFTHNGHTKKTHLEMTKLIKNLGDSRYQVAYDGLELRV